MIELLAEYNISFIFDIADLCDYPGYKEDVAPNGGSSHVGELYKKQVDQI